MLCLLEVTVIARLQPAVELLGLLSVVLGVMKLKTFNDKNMIHNWKIMRNKKYLKCD